MILPDVSVTSVSILVAAVIPASVKVYACEVAVVAAVSVTVAAAVVIPTWPDPGRTADAVSPMVPVVVVPATTVVAVTEDVIVED